MRFSLPVFTAVPSLNKGELCQVSDGYSKIQPQSQTQITEKLHFVIMLPETLPKMDRNDKIEFMQLTLTLLEQGFDNDDDDREQVYSTGCFSETSIWKWNISGKAFHHSYCPIKA